MTFTNRAEKLTIPELKLLSVFHTLIVPLSGSEKAPAFFSPKAKMKGCASSTTARATAKRNDIIANSPQYAATRMLR